MRFAVDAHAIGRHLTGNEVYIRNLLEGFAALDQSSEFIAYLSHTSNGADPPVPERFKREYVSANSIKRLGVDLSRRIAEDRPDLVHVQYTAPISCPAPIIVSVHDISFLERPEYFPWWRALQLRLTVKHTIRRAARVITPSEFSRTRILQAYDPDPAKVDVVPIAVSSTFRPLPHEGAFRWVADRFRIQAPFVLTVGDLQPRKNQIGLIRAFEQLVLSNPQLPHRLVIVGKKTWFADRIVETGKNSRIADRIVYTGFVDDDELLQLYNACDMMVFPSFYEGFGLPILEAMACGRAVACSNTSSMPEVANAAGILFDPANRDEIVRSMRDILLDAELRTRMERLGLHRASLFTWQRTAQRTLDIYHEVAGAQTVRPEAARRVPVSRR
jgi:glycosyltransferase involved in cell wall biosynthesis